MATLSIELEKKGAGILLGTAVGDILGAAVEGLHPMQIKMKCQGGELRDFINSIRGFGNYTDDTQMTLALAVSILECQKVDAADCSQKYAEYYHPMRGYGGGAIHVLEAIRAGADYRETGTSIFPKGSFANGGAMRIAPIGFVYRNAENSVLKEAVKEAIIATHVHPEGIDGALVQAKAISILTKTKSHAEFSQELFLTELLAISETVTLQKNIKFIIESLQKEDLTEAEMVAQIGNGIRADEAVACALLAAVKHYKEPEEAVIKAVNYGGDTDTIGAMTGALMGALHGTEWIPKRWFDNIENDEEGRDELIRVGKELAKVMV